jgi:hypothetical protein
MSNRDETIRTRVVLTAFAALVPALVSPQAEAVQAGPDYTYTITPCRILDTRYASGVFAGKLGPNESIDIRTWGATIISQGGSATQCPDVPADATGVYINVQAAQPSGSGSNYIGIRPYGTDNPATALNYSPGSGAIGNAQLVGTCYGQWQYGGFVGPNPCQSFDLTFNNGPLASTDLVVDITGFTRSY